MGSKGSGAPRVYPGGRLAKGWQGQTQEEKDKSDADRALFTLMNNAVTNWSRLMLYHVVMELARKWATLATTEEVRALVIEFKEYKP